jgi:hypothetical protein
MSNLFIWIYSGGGGMKFVKNLKGGVSYKNLWTSELAQEGWAASDMELAWVRLKIDTNGYSGCSMEETTLDTKA